MTFCKPEVALICTELVSKNIEPYILLKKIGSNTLSPLFRKKKWIKTIYFFLKAVHNKLWFDAGYDISN